MERFLKIRLKDPGDGPAIVPLRLNTVQGIMANYVAYCWDKKLPVRFMLPKGRQMGTSTFAQAFFFSLCELKPGHHVSTVAHDEAGAIEIFSKSKTFYREMPPTWPVELLSEQKGRMHWDNESALGSATIKTGDALGKGATLNAIHFSESANFSDKGVDATGAVTSIMNSLAEGEMSIVIHESTAKGRDPFYFPMCEAARLNKNDFQLIFLPWFLEKGYARSWKKHRDNAMRRGRPDPGKKFQPTKEEKKLRQKLANTRVKDNQQWYKYKYALGNDQLIWRRWAIHNKCQGKLDLFQRYYPSTYEEAFTASADCLFQDKDITFYRQRINDPLYKGSIHDIAGKGVWQNEPKMGPIEVWEMPIEGEKYVIGADPGGSKLESDPSAAFVLKKRNLQVVARIHGNLEWDTFSDHLESLSVFYNEALLAVENNTGRAICTRLHRNGKANLYYYTDDAQLRIARERTPGWNTNVKTRPEIIRVLDKAVRDHVLDIRDEGFVREMGTFVWVPKNNSRTEGKYMAMGSNTDDRVMALAIAAFLCPRSDIPLAPLEKEEAPKNTRAYAQFLELKKEGFYEESQERLRL